MPVVGRATRRFHLSTAIQEKIIASRTIILVTATAVAPVATAPPPPKNGALSPPPKLVATTRLDS